MASMSELPPKTPENQDNPTERERAAVQEWENAQRRALQDDDTHREVILGELDTQAQLTADQLEGEHRQKVLDEEDLHNKQLLQKLQRELDQIHTMQRLEEQQEALRRSETTKIFRELYFRKHPELLKKSGRPKTVADYQQLVDEFSLQGGSPKAQSEISESDNTEASLTEAELKAKRRDELHQALRNNAANNI